jgi:probable rRNA maturation factor
VYCVVRIEYTPRNTHDAIRTTQHAMDKIIFNIEDVDFQLVKEETISNWIESMVEKEGKKLGALSYIFCSDDYLHKLNVEYLNHDTLTDVITFPYNANPVEGDIFISIDRVRDNAQDLKIPFETELHRVMIHGVLHLCGYMDETDEEEAIIRQKEDTCLSFLIPNF